MLTSWIGLSRRDFGRVGASGLGGLATWWAGAAGAAGQPAKSCIFIHLWGGGSHIDMWDLKPQAPEEIRGAFRPIATSVPGIQIGELMPLLAKQAQRFCLVRSLSHTNDSHESAVDKVWAGNQQASADSPGFGSVLAKLRPAATKVPSYVWVHYFRGATIEDPLALRGGFLGSAFKPFVVGTSQDHPGMPKFRMQYFDPPADITPERLLQRRQLLRGLDGPSGSTSSMHSFQEQAFDLMTGASARQAFELHQEPDKVRDSYGQDALGQNLLLARRLVEAGVRMVGVTGSPTNPDGRSVGANVWDMHSLPTVMDSKGIFGTGQLGLGRVLPRVDRAVAALLEDLDERGLLASTLVVMVGEFGRAPKVTSRAGPPGRDHWPACYSALLAGAGIRGGAVHGASDKIGAYVKDKPVSLEDFGATLYYALGVPPEAPLVKPDGSSQPASKGQPILDLFG
jgi:hypothetical protein